MTIAPAPIYDVPAQQAWLEDMAAKGRFLERYLIGIFSVATFAKGPPKAVRYRLEPAADGETVPNPERREVYRALGWEYVTAPGQIMYIWRCDDPAAPELHTEPQTEAVRYDRLARRQRLLACLTALLLLLPWLLELLFRLLEPNDYFLTVVERWQPVNFLLPVLGLYLLLLWQMFREGAVLRRYLRGLRAGVPGDHRRPYRFPRAMGYVAVAGYVLLVLAVCLAPFQTHGEYQPLENFGDTVPWVVLTETDHVEALRWENWLTSEQWCIREYAPAGTGETELLWESRYYRLRLPWQSHHLVEALGSRYEGLEPLEAPGLDEAWAGDAGDGRAALVLRLGDQVWSVLCTGGEDPRDRLDDYAAILADMEAGRRHG